MSGDDLPVKFRPATPGDVEEAVPLIFSSGPEAMRYVFETPAHSALEFLRQAFVDGRGEFGYRNHIVAVRAGQVIGTAAGWGAERTMDFALQNARQIVHCYGLMRGLQVMARGLRAEAVIRPPKAGCLYIAHLGVAENCRSQGVGSALIDTLENQCGDKFRSLALDVAHINPRGLALYERIGFVIKQVRASTLRNENGFVPGMHYMERSLRNLG